MMTFPTEVRFTESNYYYVSTVFIVSSLFSREQDCITTLRVTELLVLELSFFCPSLVFFTVVRLGFQLFNVPRDKR